MNLTSLNWWSTMLISTIITMCFIFAIKTVAKKYNVPVLSTVAEAV